MAGQTPDLQAILATLARFSQPSDVAAAPLPPRSASLTPDFGTPSPEVLRAASQNSAPPVSPDTSADQLSQAHRRSHSKPVPSTAKSQIDPATITVWPDALRCVTKIAEQNKTFSASIKRMMNDQRNNEMRWYQERQALKQTQANRSAEAAKAHSILKTLNTSFYGSPPEVDSPEVDQKKELDAFDEKIYSAQEAMENAMLHELKGLGVPFCGTDSSLILPDEEDSGDSPACAGDDAKLKVGQVLEGRQKYSQIITQSQLMHMRRKMIQHLEDLYRE